MINYKFLLATTLFTTLTVTNLSQADSTTIKIVGKNKGYSKVEAHAIKALLQHVSIRRTWEATQKSLEAQFDRADPERNGISKIDQDKRKLTQQAQNRARKIQNWLVYDLDGDGQIIDAEIRASADVILSARVGRTTITLQPTEEQKKFIEQSIRTKAKLPDLNNDGTVTFSEMIESANSVQPREAFGIVRTLNQISFIFDTDKNGVIAKKEYTDAIKAVFDRFDKNKDSEITSEELTDLRKVERETAKLRR